MLRNAVCPQRKNAYLSLLRKNSSSAFIANARALPNSSTCTEWSMTNSAGCNGLISAGLPPSFFIASRIAAKSTTAGTPVKSCISTRLGVKAISFRDFVLPFHEAKARMSSAFTFRSSSVRRRFSSKIRSEKGRCWVEMLCLSSASRRKIWYSWLPIFNVERERKLSMDQPSYKFSIGERNRLV